MFESIAIHCVAVYYYGSSAIRTFVTFYCGCKLVVEERYWIHNCRIHEV